MKRLMFIASLLIILIGCNKKISDIALESAFGLRFGEVIDVDKDTEKIIISGIQMYRVEPPKKNSLYSKYYVAITPKTHKVYSIYAIKPFYDSNGFFQCLDELNLVTDLLIEKYGKNSASISEKTNIRFTYPKDGFISYECDTNYGDVSGKAYIKYKHDTFSELADEERKGLIENKNAL